MASCRMIETPKATSSAGSPPRFMAGLNSADCSAMPSRNITGAVIASVSTGSTPSAWASSVEP